MPTPKAPIPFSNYGLLSGQLFLYAGGRAAFESPLPLVGTEAAGLTLSSKKCILIGGLSDGLLPVPYTQDLADACYESSWSLVQPIISSSYTGSGHGSLQRDCDELQELMRYLIEHRNAQEFCLVGHSTGCQDAVYFLEHAASDLCDRLHVVALQAPVSDREDASQREGYSDNLRLAQAMVSEGKGDEMMPRSSFWAPITAQRFVDLQAKGGRDDYFSSDFSDDELAHRLGHVGRARKGLRVVVAYSGADEYVPTSIDKELLAQRLSSAMNTDCAVGEFVAQTLYLETGNHNLSEGPDDGKRFVEKLKELFTMP